MEESKSHKYVLTEGKAHLSVRNIIANEYGISREFVQDAVEQRTEAVVKQFLSKTDGTRFLERIIQNTVMDFIKNGVDGVVDNRLNHILKKS
jgi:hypothetical protein